MEAKEMQEENAKVKATLKVRIHPVLATNIQCSKT